MFAEDVGALVVAIDDRPGRGRGHLGARGARRDDGRRVLPAAPRRRRRPRPRGRAGRRRDPHPAVGHPGRRGRGVVLRDAESRRRAGRGRGVRGRPHGRSRRASAEPSRPPCPPPTGRIRAMSGPVSLEVADGVGVIRLDRPPANAFDTQMGLALGAAVREAGERDDVGAVVVWGGPKLFAAGADLKTLVDAGPEEARPQVEALGGACDLLEALPRCRSRPSTATRSAAVSRWRSPATSASPPRTRSSASRRSGSGSSPARAGPSASSRSSAPGGRATSSSRAASWRPRRRSRIGLVGSVVPAAGVLEAARSAPPRRSRGGRAAPSPPPRRRSGRRSVTPGRAGVAAERELFLGLFGTPDQREGMRAFLEKRDPHFDV